MSINPPSDIVLDVVRAADPSAMRAAVDKLNSLGAGRGVAATPGDAFANMLSGLPAPDGTAPADGALPFAPEQAMTGRHIGETLATGRSGKSDPYRGFEAFVLQTFIQNMLPKDSESVFGSGNAGSIWKSMLAEQIAGQLAKSGGIGIARELSGHERTRTDTPAVGGLL